MTDTATFLIVDQDAASARRLAREAQARGYAVRAAASVDEAIALIEREPSDILLVDLAPAGDRAHTSTPAALREARSVLERARVDLVLLDATQLAKNDVEPWTSVRQSGVRVIVIPSTPDAGAGEWSGQEGVAERVPPVDLHALLDAVRACAQECV